MPSVISLTFLVTSLALTRAQAQFTGPLQTDPQLTPTSTTSHQHQEPPSSPPPSLSHYHVPPWFWESVFPGDSDDTIRGYAGWDGVGLLIQQGGENRSHVLAREGFATIIPILPKSEETWNAATLITLLDSVLANTSLSLDPTRLYATGYSLGAGGTWSLLSQNATLFKAAAPVSSGPLGYSTEDYSKLAAAKTPVWGFAGSEDKATIETDVQNAVQEVVGAGGVGNFTVIDGADHHIMSWAGWEYNDGAMFDFFLAQAANTTATNATPLNATSASLLPTASSTDVKKRFESNDPSASAAPRPSMASGGSPRFSNPLHVLLKFL